MEDGPPGEKGELKMENGFYTALGTPFDDGGNFLAASFARHVEDQIISGVSGLLVMGTMGIEPYVKESEYLKIAKTGVEAANGRCPVFVGVMDNSIERVKDRIKALEGLKIDGVVATVPFYYPVNQEEIKEFFRGIEAFSPFPVYIYDLPAVTKTKISVKTIEYLMQFKKIKGIKTGDIVTARLLSRSTAREEDFGVFFSGLDIFDVAYKYGIMKNLDGMFACTAPLASRMYRSIEKEEYDSAGSCLDEILMLRDTLAGVGIFSGFTYAMNLLGYEGIFSPDYSVKLNGEQADRVRECMKKCELI